MVDKKTIISWAISIIFIIIILQFIDLEETIQNILSIGIINFLILNICFSASYILRGIKWSQITSFLKPLNWTDSTKILTIGYFFNNLLPLRAGEFARAILLSKKTGMTKSQALSTILVDRITDIIAIVGITIICLLFFDVPNEIKTGIIFLGIASVIATVLLAYNKKTIEKLSGKVQWIPQKIRRITKDILSAGEILSKKQSAKTWTYSILIWLYNAGFYWLATIFLGIEINFLEALFLGSVLAISAMIPSAPGYLGTLEITAGAVFEILGKGFAQGVALAILAHIVIYTCTTILGLIFLKELPKELKKEITNETTKR
jgi:glycosyltransferase 2 family protein